MDRAFAEGEGEWCAALSGASFERALRGLRLLARSEARVGVLDATRAQDFRVHFAAEAHGQLDVEVTRREPHAHAPAAPASRGDAHGDRAATQGRLHVAARECEVRGAVARVYAQRAFDARDGERAATRVEFEVYGRGHAHAIVNLPRHRSELFREVARRAPQVLSVVCADGREAYVAHVLVEREAVERGEAVEVLFGVRALLDLRRYLDLALRPALDGDGADGRAVDGQRAAEAETPNLAPRRRALKKRRGLRDYGRALLLVRLLAALCDDYLLRRGERDEQGARERTRANEDFRESAFHYLKATTFKAKVKRQKAKVKRERRAAFIINR